MAASSADMLSIFSVNLRCSASPSWRRKSKRRAMASPMARRTACHSSSQSVSCSVLVSTSGIRMSVANQSCGSGMPVLAAISFICR